MKKLLIVLLSLFSLTSCSKGPDIDIKGFIDEESVKIIEDLKSLASDTFKRKDFLAVSYTHLDVYKRQNQKRSILM